VFAESRESERIRMLYEEKLERAKAIIAAHNEHVEHSVSIESFIEKLKKEGGTSDSALLKASWEDLQSWGLPKLLAREVADIFRQKNGDAKPRAKVLTEARVAAMSIEDLVCEYAPEEPDSFVARRLKAISKGFPCIAFAVNGQADVFASAGMIKEYRDGYPERDHCMVNSIPTPLYRIGERPDQMATANPLYPGHILRPDETCDVTNRSWKNISISKRVLLRLAVEETGELRITRIDDAHSAIDLAHGEEAEAQIRQRYPKASICFDRLAKEGRLPTLKQALAGSALDSAKNYPFGHKRW